MRSLVACISRSSLPFSSPSLLIRSRSMASASSLKNPLISADEVKKLLTSAERSRVRLFDCSWYMPGTHGPVQVDFEAAHLKGAQHLNIDEVCDRKTTLPHMVPPITEFEAHMSNFGVSNADKVICYDVAGNFVASGRAWWLFRLFGHEDVSILAGGFNKDNFTDLIETGAAKALAKTTYKATFHPELLKYLSDIKGNFSSKKFQVLDMRPEGRFDGTVAEPRPGLQQGHMPNAINIPWGSYLFVKLLQNGRLLPPAEVKKLLQSKGVDLSAPIVTSCGSGVTALVCNVALASVGVDAAVYDGSWAEYGIVESNNPVEKTPQKA